jgi:hypothetical protein
MMVRNFSDAWRPRETRSLVSLHPDMECAEYAWLAVAEDPDEAASDVARPELTGLAAGSNVGVPSRSGVDGTGVDGTGLDGTGPGRSGASALGDIRIQAIRAAPRATTIFGSSYV